MGAIVKKIIPCMDIRDGQVVKGVRFEGVRGIDDPVALARYYNRSGADELVFYDIAANVEGRGLFAELFQKIVAEVTLPLTVAGNIRSPEDFERALTLGATKISINSGALENQGLIEDVSRKFGREHVVLAMDVKRADGDFRVFGKMGRVDMGRNALDWARFAEEHGAGELVINSIDTDGVRGGFDLELLGAVCSRVGIPVVASGGAGNMEHFRDLFRQVPKVAAGLAASIFHFKEVTVMDLKRYLTGEGIAVNM